MSGTITRWMSRRLDKDKPIYYEFTACPAAEFAIKHGLTDIMPALCNVDYASMELIHAKLRAHHHLAQTAASAIIRYAGIRTHTQKSIPNTGMSKATGGISNVTDNDH